MPCDSSYLEPYEFEKESQRTAKLIIWVSKQVGAKIPKFVRDEASNTYAKDERLVPHLCELITNMDEDTLNRVVYNGRDKTSRDLADWWDRHEKADRARERKEAEASMQTEFENRMKTNIKIPGLADALIPVFRGDKSDE